MPLGKYLKAKDKPKDSPQFQDLPPDKYPRSYSPQFKKELALTGAKSSYGSPGAGPAVQPLPSASKWLWNQNDNIQAGERVVQGKRPTFGQRLAKRKDTEDDE
jgi:hypothetical protein